MFFLNRIEKSGCSSEGRQVVTTRAAQTSVTKATYMTIAKKKVHIL